MPLRSPRTHASLVHQRVTTSNGGPHVGRDTFVKTNKVSEPVAIDADRTVRLICEFEGCNCAYDVDVFTIKKRLKIAAKSYLAVSVVLVAGSFMAQSGAWVYDAGDTSRNLRILGDVLTGTGIVINMLVLLLLLMNAFFWPPSYSMEFVEPSDGDDAMLQTPSRYAADTRPGHSVKLLVLSEPVYD